MRSPHHRLPTNTVRITWRTPTDKRAGQRGHTCSSVSDTWSGEILTERGRANQTGFSMLVTSLFRSFGASEYELACREAATLPFEPTEYPRPAELFGDRCADTSCDWLELVGGGSGDQGDVPAMFACGVDATNRAGSEGSAIGNEVEDRVLM